MKGSKSANEQTVRTGDITVGTLKPRPLRALFKKQAFRIGLGIVVLAAIVSVAYVELRPAKVTSVCGDSLSSQANDFNKLGNVSALSLLAGQIKATPQYANDPNCMYIIAESQISSADLTSAKTTMNNLKSTYGSKHVYNSKLDDGHASLANLQQQFNIMQSVQNAKHGQIDPNI